jgi:hypothetical protein
MWSTQALNIEVLRVDHEVKNSGLLKFQVQKKTIGLVLQNELCDHKVGD